MRHELWPEIESALAAALEQPENDRLAWVARSCADPEVRAEVEALLRVYGRAEDFLGPRADRSAATEARLSVGARVGPYEILSLIAAGGMGEVYRAHDPRIGRDVAIKVLQAPFSADADRLRRFALEVRAAGSLNHENILMVYDAGTHEGFPYLVTELLEGETLGSRLKRGALSPARSLEYALGIAHGLSAAHSKGIIHRDLKPDNVFITGKGQVKILDFGLARLTEPERPGRQNSASTATGMILGTAAYMSPEQVRGEACDHRSDIFSFGAVLYEMLEGRKAFPGGSQVEIMSAVLKGEPAAMAMTPSRLRLVHRCLEKDPADRFQSATDLAFSLESLSNTPESPAIPAAPKSRRLLPALAAIALLGLYTAGVYWAGRRTTSPAPPSFHQLSFRRGSVFSARFAPDGKTVVYGARWDGNTLEVFLTRPESPESRPLGLPGAEILAISSTGELAVSLGHHRGHSVFSGTLARLPLAGGAPREILENVQEADWAPDGGSLAVIVFESGRSRLEFPIGKVLHQATAWLSDARVSPKGDQVAFIEHPVLGDDGGSVAVVDLNGTVRTLSTGWRCIGGLAWSGNSNEVWFTAARTGMSRALYAVSLSGKQRLVARVAGALILQDIAHDGSILVTRDHPGNGIAGLAPGETKERELSWFDRSSLRDISADGKAILFSEVGDGGGPRYAVYLRRMDGSPAVRLGDGSAQGLSADGKWALSIVGDVQSTGLALFPAGVGPSRILSGEDIHYQHATWFPDGRRLLILGSEPAHGLKLYVRDISGGKSIPITPEGISVPRIPPSPDGRFAIARGPDRKWKLFPVATGPAIAIAGLTSNDEEPVQWTAGGDSLFVLRSGGIPAKIYRVNLATGQKEIWKQLMPTDATGVFDISQVALTNDGKAYAYSYSRLLSNVYLVEGLK